MVSFEVGDFGRLIRASGCWREPRRRRPPTALLSVPPTYYQPVLTALGFLATLALCAAGPFRVRKACFGQALRRATAVIGRPAPFVLGCDSDDGNGQSAVEQRAAVQARKRPSAASGVTEMPAAKLA